jgi:hypothetical protein
MTKQALLSVKIGLKMKGCYYRSDSGSMKKARQQKLVWDCLLLTVKRKPQDTELTKSEVDL